MEKYNIILTLIICCCLTACQWNLEEIDLANVQATCLQNCVNGTCNSNNICECQTDWQGVNCDEAIENPTTNINFCDTVNCNNGVCNEALNKCNCEDGWMGADCLTPVNNPTINFCDTVNCNNGICNVTFDRCDCFEGWQGVDCLTRQNITSSTFQKTISSITKILKANSILITNDGGYLITGTIGTNAINTSYRYVLKLDNEGQVNWEDRQESGHESIITVGVEINGNYFIGTTEPGSDRNFIVYKYDKQGMLWAFRGIGVNKYTNKLFKFSNNNFLAIGAIFSPNNQDELWLGEINYDSGVIWSKSYGGAENESVNDAIILNDAIYLSGLTSSLDGALTSNNGGLSDFLIIKTDLNGNLIWAKNYGGSEYDRSFCIAPNFESGILAGGVSQSNDFDISSNKGISSIWLINISSTGSLIWEKTYGGSAFEELHSIKQTKDGNYILGGSTASSDIDVSFNNGGSDFWLVKINPNGNILWEKTYGTAADEILSDMQVTSDGGFILVGTKDSKEIYIVKTDANGNL